MPKEWVAVGLTETMGELGLIGLEMRRGKKNPAADYSCLVGGCREGRARVLSEVHRDRMRCNGHKLENRKFSLAIWKTVSP